MSNIVVILYENVVDNLEQIVYYATEYGIKINVDVSYIDNLVLILRPEDVNQMNIEKIGDSYKITLGNGKIITTKKIFLVVDYSEYTGDQGVDFERALVLKYKDIYTFNNLTLIANNKSYGTPQAYFDIINRESIKPGITSLVRNLLPKKQISAPKSVLKKELYDDYRGGEPLKYIELFYISSFNTTIKCTVQQFKDTVLGHIPTIEEATEIFSQLKPNRGNDYKFKYTKDKITTTVKGSIQFFLILPNGGYTEIKLSIKQLSYVSGKIDIHELNSMFQNYISLSYGSEQKDAYLYRKVGNEIQRVTDSSTLRYGGNYVVLFHFRPTEATLNNINQAYAENPNQDITQYIYLVGARELTNKQKRAEYKRRIEEERRRLTELNRLGNITDGDYDNRMKLLDENELMQEPETETITMQEVAQGFVDNVETNNNNLMNATPVMEGDQEDEIHSDDPLTDIAFANEEPPEPIVENGEELNDIYAIASGILANSPIDDIIQDMGINDIRNNNNVDYVPYQPRENVEAYRGALDVINLALDRANERIGELREANRVAQLIQAYAYRRRNYSYLVAGTFMSIFASYGLHLLFAYDGSYAQKTIDFIYRYANNISDKPASSYETGNPRIVDDINKAFDMYKNVIPESEYILPDKIPIQVYSPANSLSGVSTLPSLSVSIGSIYEQTAATNQPLIAQAIVKAVQIQGLGTPNIVGPTQLDHLLGPITTESIEYVSDTIVHPIFNGGPSPTIIQTPTLTPMRTPRALPTQPIFNTIVVNDNQQSASTLAPAPWKVNYNIGGYKPEQTSLSLSPSPTPTPTPTSETVLETPSPIATPRTTKAPSKGFVDYVNTGLIYVDDFISASISVGKNMLKAAAYEAIRWLGNKVWGLLGLTADIAIKGLKAGAELLIIGAVALVSYFLFRK